MRMLMDIVRPCQSWARYRSSVSAVRRSGRGDRLACLFVVSAPSDPTRAGKSIAGTRPPRVALDRVERRAHKLTIRLVDMAPRQSATPPGRAQAGRRPGIAATREALLAAGADLFAERGYEGVPVWAIAEKAGVNKAMISYHFGGKRNLYLAIVEATFADIVSKVEHLAESRVSAPEVLRALIAAVGDVASRRHPHFCTMMLRELLAGGPHLDPKTVAMPLRVLAAVKRVVERGVLEGAFRPVDPLLTHLSLVGSLVFFFATARFRERVLSGHRRIGLPTADAYVKHIQDLATHGLAAAETRGRALGAHPSRCRTRTRISARRRPRRP